jgi:hypothetical protein
MFGALLFAAFLEAWIRTVGSDDAASERRREMRESELPAALAAASVATLLIASLASAQMSVEAIKALDATLQQVIAVYDKLPPTHQKALSGGYLNLVQFARVWHRYGLRFAEPSFQARFGLMGRGSNPELPASGFTGIAAVSDPSTDLAFSSFAGFTQSETSTARCGDNVVVGFNDSGSVFETPFFFTGTGGESDGGWALSTDGGRSFKDLGPVPPGPITGNFLGGDPMVTCSDDSTFYYSQIFSTFDSMGNPLAAVAVNKSTDGGQTWGDPIAAVSKDGHTHLLDKPWSALDPTHPRRIYVSYTDFDSSRTSKACGPNLRTAIEFVKSDDGGTTWGAPKVVIEVCGSDAVQDSQLAVDSHGKLHIAWVDLGNNFPFPRRRIFASGFVPGGNVSAPVPVNDVMPGGDSFFLQGGFRDVLDMAMTVDRSGTSSNGALYIAWADGRDKSIVDPVGIDFLYSFDDILLSASLDGGNIWNGPFKVNTDTQPPSRFILGHDHYQPGIAVDNRGFVGACWYDRRDDSENFAIRHFCGESINGGATWTNTRVGVAPFAPTHGIDVFLFPDYMGDYDVVTSDFTGANPGFIGSFQVQGNRGNPDVVAYGFQ